LEPISELNLNFVQAPEPVPQHFFFPEPEHYPNDAVPQHWSADAERMIIPDPHSFTTDFYG
jgi:hypothetical protein